MFGNKKSVKKEEPAPVAVPTTPETPDLIVQKPNMGMPGFQSDQPTKTMPDHTETGIPGFGSIGAPLPLTPAAEEQATVSAAVAAPTPAPAPAIAPAPVAAPTPAPVQEVSEQYQILAAEVAGEGLMRYVIVTNKNLGEVGGVYDA